MALTIRGLVGEIRHSWHLACELRDWTVVQDETQRSLTATFVRPDIYRLAQRPLMFVAPHAKGAYRWPILELEMSGAAVTARLGPLERSAHASVPLRPA